jgi:hypothetical protein
MDIQIGEYSCDKGSPTMKSIEIDYEKPYASPR